MNSVSKSEIELLDKYFRAANYVSACQLYLLDNPLLKRKLETTDIKNKIVGHWGTVPGQNFVYTHLNRVVKKYNLNVLYISGPGHGGNATISNDYLDGSYSKIYPNITEDEEGLKKLFKQFSFPKGVSSHAAPETPGSINEGGELGYSLSHAYGAVLDNPNLIVACVIGDGEAETGPLATSWHGNKFINPSTDGVVIPILHLNGYKIANPTILGRMTDDELKDYFCSLGYKPYFVEGREPFVMHQRMAKTMDQIINDIAKIKRDNVVDKWPMIVLRTPKGWTCPKIVDGERVENSFRAHQVPVNKENVRVLEKWLRSYKPEELFDEKGSLNKEIKNILPTGNKRIGLNSSSNGGLLLKELKVPNLIDYEYKFTRRGTSEASDMYNLGKYIQDLMRLNKKNYRIFSPDETLSNRLNQVLMKEERTWNFRTFSNDELMSPTGRVFDSMLSEHMCEGLLEGYILTGRHGMFNSYEAFIRIIDSMASQHAKWLKVCSELPWRKDISSLNYILTSHCWQQDHNGYTHQDPGFLNHLVTKKSDIVRFYLPFDTNTLLSCYDHVVQTKNYINVIIASKHFRPQWMRMNEAVRHCTKGIDILKWASDEGRPNIILACAGDTPTLEVLAAKSILKEKLPKLKVRVVNCVDLFKLELPKNHPHGLDNKEYNKLFPKNIPVIFNFHGYPSLIHELTYNRDNHEMMHVRGYIEEGTITTPFDMRVQNKIDRYHLVIDAVKYSKIKGANEVIKYCEKMLKKHNKYIAEYGKDIEEVENWKWK